MKFNIPLGSADIVILSVLAALFVGAVIIVIGFFKDGKKK